MIEVELKCKLSSELLPKLQEKLQTMQFDGSMHNRDVYYDTPEFDLLRQAVFFRVRNNRQLDFKFNEQVHKEHGQSTERTFPLELDSQQVIKMNLLFARFLPRWQNESSVEAAIGKNGLVELAHIDNRRESYSKDGIYVSVDHVEGLGDFLEVETHAEEGSDTSEAQARLQAFVADLQIEHIKVGYVELWLLQHNPQAYEAGQYHLG